MYEDGVLGYDCDHNEIYEFMILRAIWSNDIDIEDLKDEDPRQYCAVIANDGKAYAISVFDIQYSKLIRERENIPDDQEIPTIVRPISDMEGYELATCRNGEKTLYYDFPLVVKKDLNDILAKTYSKENGAKIYIKNKNDNK